MAGDVRASGVALLRQLHSRMLDRCAGLTRLMNTIRWCPRSSFVLPPGVPAGWTPWCSQTTLSASRLGWPPVTRASRSGPAGEVPPGGCVGARAGLRPRSMRVLSIRQEGGPPVFEDGPSVLKEILEDLPSFWGERDMRAQHQPVWLRQFASDAVVVRRDGVPLGYLLGAVTTHELAYVQLIATRTDHRGHGLGRLLYDTFLSQARSRGARRVEAITATTNTGRSPSTNGSDSLPTSSPTMPARDRRAFSSAWPRCRKVTDLRRRVFSYAPVSGVGGCGWGALSWCSLSARRPA